MDSPIYINGRFLSQSLSGVQRFAHELTAALWQLYPSRLVVLAPPGASAAAFPVQIVGRLTGQPWEQMELPRHARDGLLVNLGNTAPLRVGAQLVVIHDAGVYNTPEAYSRRFRLWYKVIHTRLIRSQAAVVSVSETARGELARRLRVPTDRIGLVSEGAGHMHAIASDRSILASLPPGGFILVVGNLAAHKNLAVLSVLAEFLRREGLTLVVTGAGGGAAFAGGKAAQLPATHYTGRVSDACLKALYENAECLVFPSRYEGFGLPAVEAMACGCPVVASRIPALKETCGEAALYCDPRNPVDIAEKVSILLDSPVLLERARSLGRARAEYLSWQRAAGLMAGVIDGYTRSRPLSRRAPLLDQRLGESRV